VTNIKRIFVIADLKEHSPVSIRVERRRWIKGLIRLGHDVQYFSYRDITKELSTFKSKFFYKYAAKRYTNPAMLKQIRCYHPDIIFALSMEDYGPETVLAMRQAAPKAVFIGRDCDWFPDKNKKERLAIARKMDIVIATNAGEWLKTYKKAGVPVCAFIPCPCDPDIQHPYEVEDNLKTDIIFTGTEEHGKLRNLAEPDRYAIVKRLSRMPNARIYGGLGREKIDGIDVFRAISGAKIALSINSVNSARMYHSDRLVNCLSCGTFTLAKRVPDTDLLFKNKIHLRYFDTADEFFEMADWYLKHPQEREKIAQAGMEHAHKEFNCTKIAGYMMDLIEKGSYDAPWKHIL
jgi:spore maturation protein CgeB